jgi:hypothetical protein
MKCGCELGFNHEANVGDEDFIDAENCLLPEAVALLQRMADDYVPSEDHLHFEIGQFLRKVDGGGKGEDAL